MMFFIFSLVLLEIVNQMRSLTVLYVFVSSDSKDSTYLFKKIGFELDEKCYLFSVQNVIRGYAE